MSEYDEQDEIEESADDGEATFSRLSEPLIAVGATDVREAVARQQARYNTVLKVADYDRLLQARRDDWEVDMAITALNDHGAVHGEAEILGAGAGHESTIYTLSRHVRRVWATDLYVTPGRWKREAATDMLIDPGRCAPAGSDYDLRRIVVQHVDMRNIPHPDSSFDGVFSSGSVEHVGEWKDIFQAAREIGRVVKPGGIISLSTEYKLDGRGDGWAGVKLFDEARLLELIEATGCELVDDLDLAFDGDIGEAWPLVDAVEGRFPERETHLRFGGFVFTSVHLALRKPE
jgi:SAM-dependent methyltransferase